MARRCCIPQAQQKNLSMGRACQRSHDGVRRALRTSKYCDTHRWGQVCSRIRVNGPNLTHEQAAGHNIGRQENVRHTQNYSLISAQLIFFLFAKGTYGNSAFLLSWNILANHLCTGLSLPSNFFERGVCDTTFSMPVVTMHPNKKWMLCQSLDNQILCYGSTGLAHLQLIHSIHSLRFIQTVLSCTKRNCSVGTITRALHAALQLLQTVCPASSSCIMSFSLWLLSIRRLRSQWRCWRTSVYLGLEELQDLQKISGARKGAFSMQSFCFTCAPKFFSPGLHGRRMASSRE